MITLGLDASALKTSLGMLLETGEMLHYTEELSSFEHLPLFVHKVLAKEGFQIADVQKIGLIIGPGNYTGLRCSILMAKSFASIYPIQLAGRNRLETIIYVNQDKRQAVMASQYVRMNQYYVSIGQYREQKIEYTLTPRLVSEAEWQHHAQADNLLIMGDRPNAAPIDLDLGPPLATWVFESTALETELEPFYIRPAVSP